jgi:hypothetical protein
MFGNNGNVYYSIVVHSNVEGMDITRIHVFKKSKNQMKNNPFQ